MIAVVARRLIEKVEKRSYDVPLQVHHLPPLCSPDGTVLVYYGSLESPMAEMESGDQLLSRVAVGQSTSLTVCYVRFRFLSSGRSKNL